MLLPSASPVFGYLCHVSPTSLRSPTSSICDGIYSFSTSQTWYMPLELVLNANCDMCNHFELPCLCMLASWQCHSRCSCVWSLRMFDDGGSQRFLFGAASPPRKVTRTERTILMLCFFYIYRKHIYDFTGNCSLKRLHYKHWLGQPSSFRWFGW